MDRVDFLCEVVTPMFIGGADKTKAELRESSLKGLLRFWWRMINAYRFSSNNEMLKEENNIFGSTNNASTFKINIKVYGNKTMEELPDGDSFYIEKKVKNKNTGDSEPERKSISIIKYLAYGSIYQYEKEKKSLEIKKEYYNTKTNFEVNFIFSPFIKKTYKDQIINSFIALSKYGGIGSKSRNGFGCFNINNPPSNIDEIDYNNLKKGLFKNFPAFSSNTLYLVYEQTFEKWEDALSKIGIYYRDFRLSLDNKHNYENRFAFAAPIVNAKLDNKKYRKEQFDEYNDMIKNSRLAKPLFLHVKNADIKKDNSSKNNNFQPSVLLLPYKIYNNNCYNNGFNNNKYWENITSKFTSSFKICSN